MAVMPSPAAHFAKRPTADKTGFGKSPPARVVARKAVIRGKSSFCDRVIIISSAKLTAANRTPADVTAPPAAAAVKTTGSAALE